MVKGEKGYHWIVLVVSTLAAVATLPGQTLGVSVVLDRIIDELNLTRTSASNAYMIGTLGGSAAMPLFGKLLDRFGPRRAGVGAGICFAIACCILAIAGGWVSLLVGFLLIRMFGQGALSMVSGHSISLWFLMNRGLATGIASIGGAVGNALLPLALVSATDTYGWRGSYLISAGILILGVVPLMALFLRRHPSVFGMYPEAKKVEDEEGADHAFGRSLREARRTGVFWAVLLSGLLTGCLITALLFHHFDLVASQGLSREAAGAIYIPMAMSMAASNLVSGWIVDRKPPVSLIPVSMGLLAGVCFFSQALETPTQLVLYGVMIGMTMGIQGAVGGVAYAKYFGTRYLGEIKGFTFFIGAASSAVGPPFFASLQAKSESYALPTGLSAALAITFALAAMTKWARSDR